MTSSPYFLLFYLLACAHGWSMPLESFKTKPSTNNDRHNNHDITTFLGRRDFFSQSSLLTLSTIVSLGPLSPISVSAADADDPFAALDAFAATVGSTPPSSSSLTNTPANSSSNNDNSGKGRGPQSNGSSDMNEALKDIRKQKRIDPRTHG